MAAYRGGGRREASLYGSISGGSGLVDCGARGVRVVRVQVHVCFACVCARNFKVLRECVSARCEDFE